MGQDTDQILIFTEDIENSLSQINDLIGQIIDLSNVVKEQTAHLNTAITESQISV